MKKKLIIIIIATVIIGLVSLGIFFVADGRLKHYQMNKERINNSKTLSQYIQYHDHYYMTVANNNSGAEYSLYFFAQNIKCDLLKDRNILHYVDNVDRGILVLDDYTIYETAFDSDKLYSNGQQYKQIETDIKVKRTLQIASTIYLISRDNKWYEVDIDKKQIVPYNYNTTTKHIIEKDPTIKKDITNSMTEKGNIKYIVLKTDGQIYEQEYKYSYDAFGIQMSLLKEKVLCSNEEYGHITDALYDYYGEEAKQRRNS